MAGRDRILLPVIRLAMLSQYREFLEDIPEIGPTLLAARGKDF